MSESQEIKEIKRVYAGLETLYQTYFPKSEPYLIHTTTTLNGVVFGTTIHKGNLRLTGYPSPYSQDSESSAEVYRATIRRLPCIR